ncbi:hypothetical protein ACE1OC_03275 [Streptomyces sp. DSM 116496]
MGLVAAGAVILSSAPLILERFKKPSWMPEEAAPEGEEVSADSP